MKIPKWISIGLSFILVACILALYPLGHRITVGSAHFRVRIADTEAARTRGLSGTAPLKESEGMLFVFPAPTNVSFWMKDMSYPLDMVWIDAQKKVVGIAAATMPDTYPETFSPSAPVQYVLEIRGGEASRSGIQVGDPVSF